MDDRSRVLISAVLGAAAGAVVGYLYLTESGRRVRAQLDPWLDDFLSEVKRVQGTVAKARTAAAESWRSLNELAGEPQSSWDATARRTSH